MQGFIGIDRALRLTAGIVEGQQLIADLAAVQRQIQLHIAATQAHADFQRGGALGVIGADHLAAGQLAEGRWLHALADIAEQLDVIGQIMSQTEPAQFTPVGFAEGLILRYADRRDKGIAAQAVIDIALLMQCRQPGKQGPAFGHWHFQFGKGIQVAGGLAQVIDLLALLAALVDKALIGIASFQCFYAHTPAPASVVGPAVGQAQAHVFAIDIEYLEYRMKQGFLAVETA